MLTYYIFFIIVLIVSLCFFKKEQDNQIYKFVIITILISIFAGLRSVNVGTDLLVYVKPTYLDFLGNSFDVVISRHASELFFMILMYIFSFLKMKFNLVLFFLQLIITANVMYFINKKKNDIDIAIAIMSYVTIFMGTSFNLVRQSIAISIIFIAFVFAQEKKLKRFLICVFIACFFHYSAIVSILLYPVMNIKNKKILIALEYMVFACLFVCIIFFKEFIGFGIEIGILPEKYYDYITKYYKEDIGMSMKDLAINLLLCFYIIIGTLYKYIDRKKINTEIRDEENNYSIFFLILGFVLLLLGLKIQYAGRIAYYYLFLMYLYLIPKVAKKFKNINIKMIAYILLFMYFGIEYGMLQVGNIVPYEFF